jgi:hypothetical protein
MQPHSRFIDQRRFISESGHGENPEHKKRRRNFPTEKTQPLQEWLAKHQDYPYPTGDEKQELWKQTQLEISQSPCSPRVFRIKITTQSPD